MIRLILLFSLIGVYSCNAFLLDDTFRKLSVAGNCTGAADGTVVLMGEVGKPPKSRMIDELDDDEEQYDEDDEEEYDEDDEQEYDEEDEQEYDEEDDTDVLLRMKTPKPKGKPGDKDKPGGAHVVFVCGSGDVSAAYVTGEKLCKKSGGLRKMMDKMMCNGTTEYTIAFKKLAVAVPSSVKGCLEVKCVAGSKYPVLIPALCPSQDEYGPCPTMKPKGTKKPKGKKKGTKKPKATKKPKKPKATKKPKKPKGLL